MSRRRVLLGTKATEDYGEYTPINKVSVIRRFYIDTEYIPSSESSAEMKYRGTNAQHHFLACENFYFLSPRSISNRCGVERVTRSLVNEVVTISCYRGNNNVVVNGTTIATLTPGTSTPSTSLYLLSYHGGGVNTFGFIGDFYYARIYDNNVLIRNYVPVKDSFGRVGILELISKRFWYGTDEDPAFSE